MNDQQHGRWPRFLGLADEEEASSRAGGSVVRSRMPLNKKDQYTSSAEEYGVGGGKVLSRVSFMSSLVIVFLCLG